MRIDVRKFLFVGTKNRLNTFLDAMQKAGKVQFVMKPKALSDLMGSHVYDILRALKILAQYDDTDCSSSSEYDLHHHHRPLTIRNPFSYAAEVLRMRDEIDKIDSELKVLSARLIVSQFFGDIPWLDIEHIEKTSSLFIRFFEGSTNRQFDEIVHELIPIQETGEKSYFISLLNPPSPLPSGLREISREDLKELSVKKSSLIARRNELEKNLRARSIHRLSLQDALAREANEARLQEAKSTHQTEINDTLFVMTGWTPDTAKNDISILATQYEVIAEEVQPETGEILPTYLENEGWSRVGEDLVHIYDTPSNTDKDPSWWVLGFFALFFAMIVGDAGYGLVFLGIALYFYGKGVHSSLGKRMVALVGLLGASCVAWGLLCHSFFGIPFSNDNPIKKSSLLTYVIEKRAEYHFQKGPHDGEMLKWQESHDGKLPSSPQDLLYTPDTKEIIFADKYSDNALFEAALFIGTIHIILGMLRYLNRNYGNIGWILFVIGAYLYMPSYLEATSFITYLFGIDPLVGAQIGKTLMAWGASGALIYAIIQHGITGIFECMMAVQLFADALSYLRLYALALAGALVAKIINEAAATMPMVISVILIVFSHAVNILLSTVGGVIHGLRLNFLEWYHYSFEGGGKKFIPLHMEKKE